MRVGSKRGADLPRRLPIRKVRSRSAGLPPLEKWHWVIIALLLIGASGGIVSLTRVHKETSAWANFYERASVRETVFDLQPGYLYMDETGKKRRLHDFLGDYN